MICNRDLNSSSSTIKGHSGRHAQQFLQDWQGHLVVDDYSGYKALFVTARSIPSINN
jgi:hypothetical protein